MLKWRASECEYEAPGTSLCGSTADYIIERDPPFPADSQGRTKRLIQNGAGFWGELAPHGVPVNDGALLFDKDVEAKDEQVGKTGQYTYSVWAKKIGIDDRVYKSKVPATLTVTIDPKKPEECPDFKLYGAQDGDQLRFWWPAVCDATQYKVEWSQDIFEYPLEDLPWMMVMRQEQGELIIDDPTTTETTLVVTAGAPYSSVKVSAQFRTAEGEMVDLGSDRLSFQLRRFAPVTRVEHVTNSVTVLSGSDGEPWGAETTTTSQGWRDPTACRPPSDLTFESLYPNAREALWVRTQEEPNPFSSYSSRSAGPNVVGWTGNRMTGSLVRLDYRYPADVFVSNPRPSAPVFSEQPKSPVYPSEPSPKYRDRPADVSEHIWYVMTKRGETLTDAWRAWNTHMVELFAQYLQAVQDYLIEMDSISRQYRRTVIGWEIENKQRWANHINHLAGNGRVHRSSLVLERTNLIGPLAIINQCHNVLGTLEVKELEFKTTLPSLVEVIGPWQLHQVKVTAEKVRAPKEGELEKDPPVNLREPVPDLQLEVTRTDGIIRHGTDLEALRVAAKEQGGNIDSPMQLTTDKDGGLTLYLLTATNEDASLKLTHEVKQEIPYVEQVWNQNRNDWDQVNRVSMPTSVILVGRVIEIPKRPPPVSITTVTGQMTSTSSDQNQVARDLLSPATKTVSLTVKSTDLSGRPDLRGGTATIEVKNNFGGPTPSLATSVGALALSDGRGEFALSPLSFTTVHLTLPDDVFNRTGVVTSAYTVTVSRTMENGQVFTAEKVIPVATKDLPAPKVTLTLPDVSAGGVTPTLGAGTTVPITLRAFRPLQQSTGSVVEEPVANLPVAIAVSGYKLRTTDPTDDTSTETTAWHSQTADDKDSVSIEGPDGAVWEIGDVTATLLPSLPEPLVTDENGEMVLSLTLPTDLPPTAEPPVYTLTATVTDNSTGTEKKTTAELPVAVALRTMAVTTETDQTIPGQSGDVTVTVSELGTNGKPVGPVADATVAVSTSVSKDRQALLGGSDTRAATATILGIPEADPKDTVATAQQLTLTTDGAGELRIPVSQLQTQRFPGLPLELQIAVSKPGFASLTLSGEKVATARLATRTQPVYHARVSGDLASEFDVRFTLTTAYGDPIDWYFEQVMETRKTGEDRIDEELYKTFAWLTPGAAYDPLAAFDETILMAQNPIVTDAGLGKVSFQRIESVAQAVDLVAVLRLPFLLGYGEFLTSRLGLTLPGSETPATDTPSEDTGGSSESPSPEVTSVESSEPPTAEPSTEGAPEP